MAEGKKIVASFGLSTIRKEHLRPMSPENQQLALRAQAKLKATNDSIKHLREIRANLRYVKEVTG